MRRLAPAALAAWLAAVGPARAIVGSAGEATDLRASVVMVLNRAGSAAGFCSAVVVAPDALLTAAHCVPPGGTLKGHIPSDGAPTLLDVVAVERSPGFRADAIRSRQRSIDLALVRLAEPLPPRFRPAALGGLPAHASGTSFRIAGFGLAREGAARTSGTLRAAAVVARPPASDVLLWAKGEGGSGSGACTGDSGGPVLDGDSVVAIIAWSAGEGGRQCGALTQAVWIAPHRIWIDGVLRGWGRP